MRNRIRLMALGIFISAVSGFFSACGTGGGDEGGEVNRELLRMIHAAPHFGKLTLSLPDKPEISSVTYGQSTGYLDIVEGSKVSVRVKAPNDVTPSISEDLNIASGKAYTYLITEEDNTNGDLIIKSTLITDTTTEPDTGLFNIRFINAAISSTGVDFFFSLPEEDIDQAAVAANVAFKAASSYVSIDEGEYRLRATKNTESREIYDSNTGIPFNEGDIRTVILLEDRNGGSPFRILNLDDLR